MRCLVCNAEMLLMDAVPADPTTLPGFEHHTFLCSACNRIERRLLFIGVKTKWTRAVEKLVRKQKALQEEQALAKKSSHQASAVEKPLSGGRTANPRPDAPADKPLEPPPMLDRVIQPGRRFHYKVEPEMRTTAGTSPLMSALPASQTSSSVLQVREPALDSTVISSSTVSTVFRLSTSARHLRPGRRLDLCR